MEKLPWRKLVYLWCTVEDKKELALPFLIGTKRERIVDGKKRSLDTLFKELQFKKTIGLEYWSELDANDESEINTAIEM